MPFEKTGAWRVLLLLLTCLVVTSCATTPPQPPVPTKAAIIPPLSPEQKAPPLPSGAYWSLVTQWRNDWAATLKTLQDKYGR